jgi:lathosterol oxidase
MSFTAILGTTLALTAIIALRYVAMAGAVYALIWKRPEAKVGGRRLNPDAPKPAVIRHELKLSLLSSWIYALPAAVVYEAYKHGGTLVYLDVAKYGWPWLIISGVIYLVIQDTYYYWLHRLMHDRRLFKFMHAGHHRSRQPSPFASFSFDAIEAALNAWLTPALVFFIPIHPAVILTLLTLMTVLAVLNHAGWEVLPDWLVRGPIGKWLISATHHSQHHTRFTCNYGLYFRFWDKVMGTDMMPAEKPAPVLSKA